MRAAFPVAAFTALAGAGLGTLAWVALAELGATYAGWPALAPRPTLALAGALGLALVVAGFLASALDPASRRSAWRAAARARYPSSSLELLFALALMPVAAAFVLALFLDVRPRSVWGWAAATLSLAWTVLFCTAMRHATPEAVDPHPAGRERFGGFVLGHASGAVVVEAIVRPASGPTWLAAAGVVALIAAWLIEERNLRFARSEARRGPLARLAFAIASFAVPAVWLVAGLGDPLAGAVVAIVCLAGMLAERWRSRAYAGPAVGMHGGER